MTDAIAGHGTLIARELDAAGAPGVFTTIGELGGDITSPNLQRPSTDVTPHNDTIDGYVMGVLQRGEATFPVNFLPASVTKGHDHITGLQKAIIDKQKDGYQLTYPDGTVWIFSGYVSNVAPTAPAREGALSADITLRPTGRQKIDDVFIGSIGSP